MLGRKIVRFSRQYLWMKSEMDKFSYKLTGIAAAGQTWEVEGEYELHTPSAVPDMFLDILAQSFQALTHGKAVYGRPGLGCRGPYKIDTFVVTRNGGKNA